MGIAKKRNFFSYIVASSVVLIAVLTLFSLKTNGILFDPYAAKVPSFLDEVYDPTATTGIYEGKEVSLPGIAFKENENSVLGVASEERWIEIDLSEQKIKAWEGNNLFLESLVSTGLPWWPTPQGEFRIWTKLRVTRMEGGSGKYYYNLPNVPYVMFFENDSVPGWRGFGLHGTYWHNDFGTVRSHGCVNLPTPVAEKLYYWSSPNLPSGKSSVMADAGNIGTRIVIHE